MKLGNLPKNVVGLCVYFPILVANSYAESVVRWTSKALDWFESDELLGGDPDGPVDGDSTDDIETTETFEGAIRRYKEGCRPRGEGLA